jgi:hypothetical protein
MLLMPRPAPRHCSPSAAALASFSMKTGIRSAFSSSSQRQVVPVREIGRLDDYALVHPDDSGRAHTHSSNRQPHPGRDRLLAPDIFDKPGNDLFPTGRGVCGFLVFVQYLTVRTQQRCPQVSAAEVHADHHMTHAQPPKCRGKYDILKR